jgi:hypothetical protein
LRIFGVLCRVKSLNIREDLFADAVLIEIVGQ